MHKRSSQVIDQSVGITLNEVEVIDSLVQISLPHLCGHVKKKKKNAQKNLNYMLKLVL